MATMKALVKKEAGSGVWLDTIPVPTFGINANARPSTAVLVRPVSKDLREVGEEVVVDLARAILGAAVDEAGLTLREEPMDCAHDRRW